MIKLHPFYTNQSNVNLSVSAVDGKHNINISTISYISRDDGWTKIHSRNNETIRTTSSLKDFEDMLKEYHFLRINRQEIVNLRCVSKILKGRYPELHLFNGVILIASDRKRKIVNALF